MAMFKAVATEHLKVVFFAFLLGNSFHAFPLPPSPAPANSCGSDLRLLSTHRRLVFESVTAAMLLLAVLMLVNTAEASAVAAARAAASARGEAFDTDKEAAAVAARGIGASVPAWWTRGSLRALLYLAVCLSGAASLHAIAAFEDGFLYRAGCHGWYGAASPFEYILTCLVAVVLTFSAEVAMYQN